MEFESKSFITKDNTLITYYITGKGSDVIFIFNGLGGSFLCFNYLIDYFYKDFKIISFDYRGLYNSKLPENNKNIKFEDILNDAEQIIEIENIKSAIVIGWSLGVQFALEFYRKNPLFVNGLILISGPYKNLVKNGSNFKLLNKIDLNFESFFEKTINILSKFDKVYSIILRNLSYFTNIVKILKKFNFVNKNINEMFFYQIIKNYTSLNMENLLNIVLNANKINSQDVLSKINIPTLVIGSTNDIFSPFEDAVFIKENVRNSKFLKLEKGTHYGLLEFPDLINKEIELFFKENNLLKRETNLYKFAYSDIKQYNQIKYRKPFLLANGNDGIIRFWFYETGKFYLVKEIGIQNNIFPKFDLLDKYLFYAIGNELFIFDINNQEILDKKIFKEKIKRVELKKDIIEVYFNKYSYSFVIKDNKLLKCNFSNYSKLPKVSNKIIKFNKKAIIRILNNEIFFNKLNLNNNKPQNFYFLPNKNIFIFKDVSIIEENEKYYFYLNNKNNENFNNIELTENIFISNLFEQHPSFSDEYINNQIEFVKKEIKVIESKLVDFIDSSKSKIINASGNSYYGINLI